MVTHQKKTFIEDVQIKLREWEDSIQELQQRPLEERREKDLDPFIVELRVAKEEVARKLTELKQADDHQWEQVKEEVDTLMRQAPILSSMSGCK